MLPVAIRGLSAPPQVPWRTVLFLAGFVAVNLIVAHFSKGILAPQDWWQWELLPNRLETGRLYSHGPGYFWVWSPVAAWLMASIIVPLGYPLWFGLHVGVLALLRSWRLVALCVLTLPFWVDTVVGNGFVFVFAAGIVALRGNRWGAIGYLALCCLMPRPLQAPLALWLLWKLPDVRIPFAIMAGGTLAVSIGTGYLDDWVRVLVSFGPSNYDLSANLSPTRWLGSGWMIVGLPLAAWLTWNGRVGLAGLAMSPYILPMYPIALLWDRWGERAPAGRSAIATEGQQHRNIVSMRLAPARVVGSAGGQGDLGRREDRIGSIGIQQ